MAWVRHILDSRSRKRSHSVPLAEAIVSLAKSGRRFWSMRSSMRFSIKETWPRSKFRIPDLILGGSVHLVVSVARGSIHQSGSIVGFAVSVTSRRPENRL